MTKYEQLTSAFRTALGGADDSKYDAAEYGVTPGWDSMAHMQLVSEIEGAFDLMLNTDEVISLSSFTRAKEILKEHGIDVAA